MEMRHKNSISASELRMSKNKGNKTKDITGSNRIHKITCLKNL